MPATLRNEAIHEVLHALGETPAMIVIAGGRYNAQVESAS